MTDGRPGGGDATAAGRLWGGRFAQAPADAAWRLGRSVDFDLRLWREDLEGSRAHADVLRSADLLSEADHAAIVGALDVIADEMTHGAFELHDDDEDLHGAVERRLVELAGEAGGRLRAGRSRNDQIANDLRRWLVRACSAVSGQVADLQRALLNAAVDAVDVIVPGYTHLQRAQPVTLAHHLLAHAWAFDRDRTRMTDAAVRAADVCPLGAGALAGLTLDLDPQAYAESLGYARVAPNSMDVVADRDFAVEALAAAALCGVHLSRLGEELVRWSSTEVGWVRLADAYSTGSSIMPQKRNPDVAELVRGKSGRLVGDLVALLVTLKGLPLTYNRDLQEDKEPVFDAIDTLSVALPAMTGAVATATFTPPPAEVATGGYALATDLAEQLVARGVAFRVAHERVGALVAELEADDVELDAAAWPWVVAALPELADAPPDLLSPAAAVARRDGPGGPAPARVREQIAVMRERLGDADGAAR